MKAKILSSFIVLFLVVLISCDEKCLNAPVQSAGSDTIVYNDESVVLKATTEADSGRWSIVTGPDGSFDNATSPKATFSGKLNNEYKLVWKSENDCGISTDTINVSFLSKYSVDQMVDNLIWNTQSSFRMKGTGVTVYIDPQGIKAGAPMADVILITHSHGDHYSPSEIKKIANENTLIYGPASCKYRGVCKEFITVLPGDTKSILSNLKFKAVPAYNVGKITGHPKSDKNVGYLVTLDGVTVYHAGDSGRMPELKEMDCDIALLPLGQTYTMESVADAAEAAKDVKAEVAIPMHYAGGEGTVADASTFKSLLEPQIKVVIKTRE